MSYSYAYDEVPRSDNVIEQKGFELNRVYTLWLYTHHVVVGFSLTPENIGDLIENEGVKSFFRESGKGHTLGVIASMIDTMGNKLTEDEIEIEYHRYAGFTVEWYQQDWDLLTEEQGAIMEDFEKTLKAYFETFFEFLQCELNKDIPEDDNSF